MNPIPLTREAWLLFAINHLAPIARLEKIAAVLVGEIGPYPHAKLMVGGSIYEQARKPARAECPHCKFKISMLRQYLDIGPPASRLPR